MTAKVYQFKRPVRSARRPPPDVEVKTNMDIFRDVLEDVLGEWQSAAVRDQLDSYIIGKLPSKVKVTKGKFLDDLNLLSRVEKKLDMRVASFCPGASPANPLGWLAAFHRGTEIFATPPDMASEAAARALNIVLFVSFERTLKTLDRA